MGFKICWLGFHGIDKDAVLDRLGLHDTGEVDEANEGEFSGTEIPGGWMIVWSDDFTFPRALNQLDRLSVGCSLLCCMVHEGTMFSTALAFENGVQVWEVVHDAQEGLAHLTVSGKPPDGFEAIRKGRLDEQAANGGGQAEVDYIFDIPVETAASVCGYRHDRFRFDWGEPKFTRLADAPDG